MASLWFISLFVQFVLFTSQVKAGTSFDGTRPDNRQFQWKWKNDVRYSCIFPWLCANFRPQGIQFLLPSCAKLDIEVKAWDAVKNDTHGVPPYYMMSFPIGGTPVTTLLGDDPTKLSWQPTHAPGEYSVPSRAPTLTCGDSSQAPGLFSPSSIRRVALAVSLVSYSPLPVRNIRPFPSYPGLLMNLFPAIDTLSTACVVPEPSAPNFTITSNITKPLETCDPWGIKIKGGVPPYNVTIAAVNSPIITNVSFSSGFDAYTYINRADPGGQMICAFRHPHAYHRGY